MAWRWTARRWALSAFVLFHLSALVMWTTPNCAIKAQCVAPYRYYVLPLGLWQWWAIFAPDPWAARWCSTPRWSTSRGCDYTYPFTRLSELSWWQKFPRYRNCKFVSNMLSDEYKTHRTFTARHAVRELLRDHTLSEESFPLGVSLYTESSVTPPPGTGKSDPMAQPIVHQIASFQFASPKEVQP